MKGSGSQATDRFEGIPLRTKRLRLRPYRDSDAAAILAIRSDPKVMRFWSSPPWTSIEQAHELIARDTTAFKNGNHLALAIERSDDSRYIGHCALFNLSRTCRRAEIGYGLASWAWGHGFMNEALNALIDYGFGPMNLNRVEADIDPMNEASARTLERLGFEQEGLLHERWIVNGEVSDSAIYGLLRKDWKPR